MARASARRSPAMSRSARSSDSRDEVAAGAGFMGASLDQDRPGLNPSETRNLASVALFHHAPEDFGHALLPDLVGQLLEHLLLRALHLEGAGDQLGDRKSTRLNSSPNAHLVCRLLLEKKKHIS